MATSTKTRAIIHYEGGLSSAAAGYAVSRHAKRQLSFGNDSVSYGTHAGAGATSHSNVVHTRQGMQININTTTQQVVQRVRASPGVALNDSRQLLLQSARKQGASLDGSGVALGTPLKFEGSGGEGNSGDSATPSRQQLNVSGARQEQQPVIVHYEKPEQSLFDVSPCCLLPWLLLLFMLFALSIVWHNRADLLGQLMHSLTTLSNAVTTTVVEPEICVSCGSAVII